MKSENLNIMKRKELAAHILSASIFGAISLRAIQSLSSIEAVTPINNPITPTETIPIYPSLYGKYFKNENKETIFIDSPNEVITIKKLKTISGGSQFEKVIIRNKPFTGDVGIDDITMDPDVNITNLVLARVIGSSYGLNTDIIRNRYIKNPDNIKTEINVGTWYEFGILKNNKFYSADPRTSISNGFQRYFISRDSFIDGPIIQLPTPPYNNK